MKDWTGSKNSVFKTLGSSHHCIDEREADDFYATDPKAVELLLQLEEFDLFVWECACGQGHMSKALDNAGYFVHSTDLVDRGFGNSGIDFLQHRDVWYGDIITNPPYKYAKEFIEKAIEIIPEGNRIAMFLKVQFVEGKGRKELFTKTPPHQNIRFIIPYQLCKEW